MKKLFTLIAMAMMAIGSYAATAAETVAGTYTVYTDVNFAYVSRYVYTYTDETVTITANDDGTAEVAYSNDTWGDYALTGATVTTNDDGSYTVTGEGTCSMALHSGGTSEYYCEGTIDISDGSITEGTLTVEAVMGGTTVTFASGDAPAYELGSGDHRVYAEVMFAYISTPMCNAYDTITVAISGAETVDITYSNDTWGDYTIEGATVTLNDDGSYSLTGTGTGSMASHSGGTTDYYCDFTATADAEGVFTEATFYMEAVMGGTSVVCTEGSAPAYAIAGDYVGSLTGVFAYGTLDSESDTVTIDYVDTDYATVTLNDSTWGEFVVESVEVIEGDDYTMSGTGTVAMDNHSGGTNDYEFDFEGTISLDLSEYTFVYTLEIMGGTTITVTNTEDETGIQTVTVKTGTSTGDGTIYNLSGMKVDASYKGVVIRNGKKYIQK